MLDVAIVGGGLSGLALARKLTLRQIHTEIFEARDRPGGRVFSVKGSNGGGLDLGAGWFWPETQPLVTALVRELELASYAQHDEGDLLHLREADKRAERLGEQKLYDGARRLHGGTTALIDGLAAHLPADVIRLGHRLMRILDCGDHVELTFLVGGDEVRIAARRAVLTLPPRLLNETIQFSPPMDDHTRQAMAGAETWMGAQAKVAIEFAEPFWRNQGLSGSAYVTHEQAILGEIFDACDPSSHLVALGGFVALTPELRESFSVGLPMLIKSQIGSVFGREVEPLALHFVDWAKEPFTCSDADRTEQPHDSATDTGNPMLRQALWDKKLYFGGTETAVRNAGYLEGALDSARRVERALTAIETKITPSAFVDDPASVNDAGVAHFCAWVDRQTEAVLTNYRRRLNKALASQDRNNLSQIAILGAIDDLFIQALKEAGSLSFDLERVTIDRGRVSLTPLLQKPFGDLLQSVMDDVVAFNRTSCALSNFPDEHHLSKEYKSAIMQDIAAAWRDFSLSLNGLLLENRQEPLEKEKTP